MIFRSLIFYIAIECADILERQIMSKETCQTYVYTVNKFFAKQNDLGIFQWNTLSQQAVERAREISHYFQINLSYSSSYQLIEVYIQI